MKANITFAAERFLKEYNIDATQQHPHCTPNRINIHCPFCKGSRDYHLGIHITHAYGNCWRCGPHSMAEIIRSVLNVTWREAYNILEEYADIRDVKVRVKAKTINHNKKLILPAGIVELNSTHASYLQSRNFNPQITSNIWGLRSTGVIGEYKHRIFIPITYRDEVVSFQGRTPYEHVGLRYKTCEKHHEKIHHKHLLYGSDKVTDSTIVVVEGVTDVWRLGPGAVCTFGLSYTREQVYLISRYKNIFILFDNEPAAQAKAEKLANEVAFINKSGIVKIIRSPFEGDPGELPQHEADLLMQKVLIQTQRR